MISYIYMLASNIIKCSSSRNHNLVKLSRCWIPNPALFSLWTNSSRPEKARFPVISIRSFRPRSLTLQKSLKIYVSTCMHTYSCNSCTYSCRYLWHSMNFNLCQAIANIEFWSTEFIRLTSKLPHVERELVPHPWHCFMILPKSCPHLEKTSLQATSFGISAIFGDLRRFNREKLCIWSAKTCM